MERVHDFGGHINTLMTASSAEAARQEIAFFCSLSPLARRAWRFGERRFTDVSDLRVAGYQVSELANDWVFTVDREALQKRFGAATMAAIDRLSIKPGALATRNIEHMYMDNPIWRQPFIARPDGSLFIALPQLVFSFPFLILEHLIEDNKSLQDAYANARSEYLEDAIAGILRKAMPSAAIYSSVEWDDPDTGIRYENDVVACLGNIIFAFEAKSGRISDIARRGGEKSLAKNVRELFVEPGLQASRLQSYLDARGTSAVLWQKSG